MIEKSKTRSGITYYYSAGNNIVRCGEHSQNPHDVNHQASCSYTEFTDLDNSEGARCRAIIRDNFSQKTLSQVLKGVREEMANH
ncbi:MAG: hypothetical protein OEZ36_01855 [Spirochaetota bacterium]|nr:hypothetical protein [Spirochaetota bacterium]